MVKVVDREMNGKCNGSIKAWACRRQINKGKDKFWNGEVTQ